MLIHWQSHQEYLYFLHETKVHLDSSQRTRLRLEFGAVREKLNLLNLDPVMDYLSGSYSHLGRPAKNQTQILRSFVLMVMLGFTGLTAWVEKLKADSLLAILIGCSPGSLPPLGSYFDLMDRLWAQPLASQKTGRKDLFPAHKNKKPSKKTVKERSFLINIPASLNPLPLTPSPMKSSPSILKRGFSRFSVLPQSSLPSRRGSSQKTA